MNRRKKPHAANRAYHDRVASKYDSIYDSSRWDLYFDLSWEGMKPFIPRDAGAPVIDLGCGTGKYGLRLAKSGYRATLTDLSPKMVDRARQNAQKQGLEDGAVFQTADIGDLESFPRHHFALAVAQGDPLGFAENPIQALRGIRRILRPEGILIASVDQTYAALDHHLENQDLDGIETLLKTHEMTWLAHREEERFRVHTFTAETLTKALEKTGFEVLDLFGKTILPLSRLKDSLNDSRMASRIAAIERKHCRKPSIIGRCAHLQVAARAKDSRSKRDTETSS